MSGSFLLPLFSLFKNGMRLRFENASLAHSSSLLRGDSKSASVCGRRLNQGSSHLYMTSASTYPLEG
jgi:hypothetical protein